MAHRIQRHRITDLGRWMNRADQEPNQKQRRDGERRKVKRTVLPQFAPHGPVEAIARRDHYRHSYVHFEWRHGVRLRIHRAAPLALPVALPAWLPASLPMMATNKSAMPAVRTSPNAASCWRST